MGDTPLACRNAQCSEPPRDDIQARIQPTGTKLSNDLVVQLGAKLDQFASDMNQAGDMADSAVAGTDLIGPRGACSAAVSSPYDDPGPGRRWQGLIEVRLGREPVAIALGLQAQFMNEIEAPNLTREARGTFQTI